MSQFAGWLAQRYRNNRPLSKYEKGADVRNFDASTSMPLDNGVVYLDDNCIEYVDRHFLYRGWAVMGGFVVISLVPLFVSAIAHATVTMQAEGKSVSPEMAVTVAVLGVLLLGLVAFVYWMLLGRDIFRHQYYPIRFDRTTHQVHVFTGGRIKVISAAWSDLRFIIGRDKPAGPGEDYTYDLMGL